MSVIFSQVAQLHEKKCNCNILCRIQVQYSTKHYVRRSDIANEIKTAFLHFNSNCTMRGSPIGEPGGTGGPTGGPGGPTGEPGGPGWPAGPVNPVLLPPVSPVSVTTSHIQSH